MTNTPVLVIHTTQAVAAAVSRDLRSAGHTAVIATSLHDVVACLQRQRLCAAIVDAALTEADIVTMFRAVRQMQPSDCLIVVADLTAPGLAVRAIGLNRKRDNACADAFHRVARPSAPHVEEWRAGRDEDGQEASSDTALDRLLGKSPAMRALKAQIRVVAQSEATILLIGETGTGKELVARAVHAQSLRRHGPFVAVNCAAIPEALLESELFGHDKGAFTGANQPRPGLFAEAHAGTILLDEIGDMPPALQAKILRVLQERTVRRVGASDERPVSIRVIAATNRDLRQLVAQKRFRADLYYRLAVIPIEVPSLRERTGDVAALAQHFAERVARMGRTPFAGFTPEAIAWLQRQRWPGNVRELQNLIERAVTLAASPLVGLSDLRPALVSPPINDATRPTLAELEHRYTQRVLKETKGNKRAAARILGISLRTMQRRVPRPPLDGWDDDIALEA